jgi:hypothetical protein
MTDEDDPIAFVRQWNPQRGFSPGRLLLAYQDTLSRVDDPLFNFDMTFDLVVAPDEIVVLSTTAFNRVFADLDLLGAQVPDQATQLNTDLGKKLSATGLEFLTTTCQSRPRLAQRLRRVAQAAHLASVTEDSLSDALERHGLGRDRFGSGPEVELQSTDDVVVFLDMLEQLYFEADFTGEPRRADRYSTRT